MTRAALTLAATLLLATSALAQDPLVVTREEALRLAVERSPAAVNARAATRIAEAGVLESRGDWLPSLSTNSSYRNSSNERFDQSTGRLVSESYTAQVSAAWNVFTGGRRLADGRAAHSARTAAVARERGQRFATILETTRVFYEAAAAEELVAAAEQRLERARRQLEFVETRRLVGTATRSDGLRAELEEADAELAVVNAGSELRRARLSLGRQIGHSGPVRPESGTLPETAPELPPIEALVRRAEERAPGAVAGRADLESAEADRRSAIGRYSPTVQVAGSYDWFDFDFPPGDESWSLRVTASIPLFDNFQREADLARADADRRSAESLAFDAVLAARAGVEDAAGEIGAAERRVEIARRALELAREDLRVVEERYRIGAATILDLQASQVALADVEVDWIRARQGLGVAVAALEAELGEPIGGGA